MTILLLISPIFSLGSGIESDALSHDQTMRWLWRPTEPLRQIKDDVASVLFNKEHLPLNASRWQGSYRTTQRGLQFQYFIMYMCVYIYIYIYICY